MGSELILERDKLKVVSADTRIKIINKLAKRRSTLSDLSKTLNLSKPTLKEHLVSLESAGFVKKIDSDNIWKYYELTDNGRSLLNPSGVKVMFLFAIFFVFGFIFMIRHLLNTDISESYVATSLETVSVPVSASTGFYINWELWIAIILFVFALGFIIYFFYLKNKKRMRNLFSKTY